MRKQVEVTERDIVFLAQTVACTIVGDPTNEDIQEQAGFMEGACISKFEGYMTDGPGFFGTVYTIVWPASPNTVSVVTVNSKEQISVYQSDLPCVLTTVQ